MVAARLGAERAIPGNAATRASRGKHLLRIFGVAFSASSDVWRLYAVCARDWPLEQD